MHHVELPCPGDMRLGDLGLAMWEQEERGGDDDVDADEGVVFVMDREREMRCEASLKKVVPASDPSRDAEETRVEMNVDNAKHSGKEDDHGIEKHDRGFDYLRPCWRIGADQGLDENNVTSFYSSHSSALPT
ncbi:uncharacterized protein RCO7_14568 [Rhynchosporium graminicola]|uniref:Uncharacterized protein n=1 Tax=Rhynchosporium graminicola TaxID=2792576 RepID=A0A1E1KPN5_9HELO|nr:uncharacterized protein RCO7_14568 [Rhynchosporium commune]